MSLPTLPEPAVPLQPLLHLDALWIQVAGTLCNLACTHCFVSAGPGNRRHGLMSRDAVRARVAEALPLGVREFYLTGGEPFLHPELLEILADTLAHGPCTVLTNGTLLTPGRLRGLAALAASSPWSLELRVSLDGATADEHDAVRGAGAFARALDGLLGAQAAGLLPIVTLTRREDEDPAAFVARHVAALRAAGVARPRLKVLTLFRLGRAATAPGDPAETLAGLGDAFDPGRLPCGSGRAVSTRGVHVCPLLVDEPSGRLGQRLDEALGPFPLAHATCFRCWVTGTTCGNG